MSFHVGGPARINIRQAPKERIVHRVEVREVTVPRFSRPLAVVAVGEFLGIVLLVLL